MDEDRPKSDARADKMPSLRVVLSVVTALYILIDLTFSSSKIQPESRIPRVNPVEIYIWQTRTHS
jgi:hypothetical protein